MRSTKHRRRQDKLQPTPLFRRLHSQFSQASVHLPPSIRRKVFDPIALIHWRFMERDLLGYGGDGAEHRHDPIVQIVKIPRAQPKTSDPGT